MRAERVWLKSLQAQLAARLTAVILVATAFGLGALLYEGTNAADALGNEELARRATEITQYIGLDLHGAPGLELPPKLEQAYRSPNRTEIFAVRTADGRMIATSEPDLAAVVARLSSRDTMPHHLRLEELGSTNQDYYGLVERASSAAGPVTILVALRRRRRGARAAAGICA
jgi:hypothetical protein